MTAPRAPRRRRRRPSGPPGLPYPSAQAPGTQTSRERGASPAPHRPPPTAAGPRSRRPGSLRGAEPGGSRGAQPTPPGRGPRARPQLTPSFGGGALTSGQIAPRAPLGPRGAGGGWDPPAASSGLGPGGSGSGAKRLPQNPGARPSPFPAAAAPAWARATAAPPQEAGRSGTGGRETREDAPRAVCSHPGNPSSLSLGRVRGKGWRSSPA